MSRYFYTLVSLEVMIEYLFKRIFKIPQISFEEPLRSDLDRTRVALDVFGETIKGRKGSSEESFVMPLWSGARLWVA